MYFQKPSTPWHKHTREMIRRELERGLSHRHHDVISALHERVKQLLHLLERGDLLTAYLELGSLLHTYYWSCALHFCAGYTAARINDRALAMSHYTRALNHTEIGVLAARHMMTLMYVNAEYQTLKAFAESRLNLQSAPEYHYALGLVYRQRSDLERAKRAFRQALKESTLSDEDRVSYRVELVKCLYMTRDYHEALRSLNRAEPHEVGELNIILLTAKCHFRLGEEDLGFKVLRRAHKRYSNHVQLQITYADEVSEREPKRAIKYYLRALKRANCPNQVYLHLAKLHERLQDWDEAIYYLRQFRAFYTHEDLTELDAQLKRLERRARLEPSAPWYQRVWRVLTRHPR